MVTRLWVDVGDLHGLPIRLVRLVQGQRFERGFGVGPRVAQHRVGFAGALKHGRGHHAAARITALTVVVARGLAAAVHVVAGFQVMHDGKVQHVQPDHRLGAIVAVLVPQPGGRQDQIAAPHGAFFTLHRAPRALAFHHHTHRVGRVAVRRCPFTWQQQLHAQVNGGAGLHFFKRMARIGQHQDAALGFLDGREFARLDQQRADGRIRPMRGLCRRPWLFRRQHGPQAGPQRHQVVRLQLGNIVSGQVFQAAKLIHVVPQLQLNDCRSIQADENVRVAGTRENDRRAIVNLPAGLRAPA